MAMNSERVTAHRETGEMMVNALTTDANQQIDNVSQQQNEFGFLYDSEVRSGFGHELLEHVRGDMAKASETFHTQIGQARGTRDGFETLLDAPRQAAQVLRSI
ncbi:hypothetical protein ED92_23890 [Amycolatopsis sp. MJM2582]|uniref:hypothetical protein n=1 Tax=Amycolatopsis TaxID=1813 RepID=UPI000505AD70|nr:hypothetical protein [Amycolatopsis sp. MJM2582]KFZ80400.1 hypothetical protein ED92_23890 [Amycolatopsis sp. MJM2582]